MSERVGKVCVMCGGDCANSPRIKDPRGRYYHKSCYEEARAKRGGAAAMAAVGTSDEAFGEDDLLGLQRGFDLESITGELQAPQTCPQCSSPLDHAAVLCVKCGYNVRENAPLAPPVLQRAPRASGPRMTVWPIVIGVISLLYSGLLLVGALLVDDDMPSQFSGGALQKVVGSVFALWLTIAALGVLFRRQSGAVWMMRWAIVQIVLSVVCGGLAVVVLAAAGSDFARRTGADADYLLGVLVGEIIIGLIWPIFLVIWLRRPAVQKKIGEWG